MAGIKNIFQLGSLTDTKEKTVHWLRENELLFAGVKCEDCLLWMSEVKDTSRIADGYTWRCSSCKKKASIREGSFFQGSHLLISTIIRIVYMFCLDIPIKNAEFMLSGDVSHVAITDWYNFCRDVCTTYLTRNPVRLGGPLQDDIVELDEALYKRKNKYHRGHDRGGGQWVFGIIERKNSKVMLWTVPDRTRDTLQPKIVATVLPGTMIFSDSARMYDNLDQIGFRHESVNHSVEFVRNDGVNTNKIEGYWGNSKQKFKQMRGVHPEQMNAHLDEIIYKHNRNIDAQAQGATLFQLFLEDMKIQYRCEIVDRMPLRYNIMPPPRY